MGIDNERQTEIVSTDMQQPYIKHIQITTQKFTKNSSSKKNLPG